MEEPQVRCKNKSKLTTAAVPQAVEARREFIAEGVARKQQQLALQQEATQQQAERAARRAAALQQRFDEDAAALRCTSIYNGAQSGSFSGRVLESTAHS